MPGDAILNYFDIPGKCGYLPPLIASQKSATGEGGVLVKYDTEEESVVRTQSGRCILCLPNEIGEMIMRLPNGKYDGYIGEKETNNKLYRNVFEDGDVWWSSGDLLSVDEIGFFTFEDRAGDSFRRKGENVSTAEIEIHLGKMKYNFLEINGMFI